jgi:hypothetical protein
MPQCRCWCGEYQVHPLYICVNATFAAGNLWPGLLDCWLLRFTQSGLVVPKPTPLPALATTLLTAQVVVRKNPDAATDEERARLEVVGRFHCGEFVNRLRPGSLVMRLPDSELGCVPRLLYGGVNGSVGLVASLPREWYDMLLTLQEGLKKVRWAAGL